jgi:LemA protein
MRNSGSNFLIIAGVLFLFVCGVGLIYNSLVTREENVNSAWSQVQNQVARRVDLASQLVAAVKATFSQELAVFEALERQAASLNSAIPRDEDGNAVPPRTEEEDQNLLASLQSFDRALVNAVSYAADNPDIGSTQVVRDLMVSIEGSENRVAVARKDYIAAITSYRTTVRRFPTNILANIFGFEYNKFQYYEAPESAQNAPVLDFENQD